MQRSEPREYVTLPSGRQLNLVSIVQLNVPGNNGSDVIRHNASGESFVGETTAALTKFTKIRLDVMKMQLISEY